jgi:hypothetical protein
MMEPFRFASATIQNLGSETLINKNSIQHLPLDLRPETEAYRLCQPMHVLSFGEGR